MARDLPDSAMKALVPLASLAAVSVLPAQIFAPPQSQPLPSPIASIFDLAIADLDGDGFQDGVLREASGLSAGIRPFRGDGSGGFVLAPQGIASSLFPQRDLVLADLDGDGAVDLLAGAPGMLRLRNDGSGAFTAWPVSLPTSTLTGCVGDFDGDRQADLMVRLGNDLGLMLADGSGGFGPVQVLSQALGVGNGALNAGDVDGDGDVDLVVGPGSTLLFHWVRNDGAGSFAVQPIPLGSLVGFPNSSALVDLDADHLPDLVVRSGFGGIGVYQNLGGSFASLPVVFPTATDLAVADVDGDGAVELVVVDASGLRILRADGASGYTQLESHPVGASGRVAIGDFDGDGAPDLLVGSAGGMHVLKNQQPTPTGVSRYGVGTPSCRGRIGMRTIQPPTLGSQLRVLCSNAPANGTGLLAMGTRVTNGWDPLGLDLVFHLGLAFPVGSMTSDAGGAGQANLSIPPIPWLAGLRVHLQSFWLADAGSGDTCSKAYMDFVSSRGLSLRLQH